MLCVLTLEISNSSVADREMAFNSIIGVTIDKWANQTEIILEDLFDGADKHIRTLTELIIDGRSAAGFRSIDSSDVDKFVEEEEGKRAFYAVAIPTVWKETGQAPAVIDAGDCEGDGAIPDIVAAGEVSYSCYKDRAYFIVSAPDGARGTQCVAPEVITTDRCSTRPMRSPRGLSELDGKDWGTVDRHDIIAG